MNFIEELQYGNINPSEKRYKKATPYDKELSIFTANEDKLEEVLSLSLIHIQMCIRDRFPVAGLQLGSCNRLFVYVAAMLAYKRVKADNLPAAWAAGQGLLLNLLDFIMNIIDSGVQLFRKLIYSAVCFDQVVVHLQYKLI